MAKIPKPKPPTAPAPTPAPAPAPVAPIPELEIEAPTDYVPDVPVPDLEQLQEDAEHNEELAERAAEVDQARKLIARAAGPINELLGVIASTLVSLPSDGEAAMRYAAALRRVANAVKDKTN